MAPNNSRPEKFQEWQSDFGIDPRSKANLRRNGKNVPQGIDWDALINKGLQKGSGKSQTPLGFINDQQKKRGK